MVAIRCVINREKKDSRRQITAFIFLVFLFFVYKITIWDIYFYGPPQPKTGADSSAVDLASQPSAPGGPQISASGQIPTKELAQTWSESAPSDEEISAAGEVVTRTDTLELKLSLLGGRVIEARLLDFKETLSASSPALNLIKNVNNAPFPMGV